MKKLLVIVTVLLTSACRETDREEVIPLTECSFFANEVVRELTEVEGRIVKVADTYLIASGEQQYAACNLPERFQVVDARIRFDAKEFAIPAWVRLRLMGTPISITKIY